MSSIYIDTNVFLARMDKNHQNNIQASRFLKEIRHEGNGVVSTYVIFELIWVLIYLKKNAYIPIVLDKIFKTNVKIIPVTEEILLRFRNTYEPIKDAKDFLHYTIMASCNLDTIATFNPKHFKAFNLKIYKFNS
ncbi:MAG TPA: PIN domain-containing protein [Candidatus Lokiarchaeia archaeon]|nr:PIN domain-containing protein [Candidatus Lokiarchaeia archaeon]